jgi:hypothetical protein
MIQNKSQIIKVVREVSKSHKFTREEKFTIFVNVCDNMLSEGRITQKQHHSWTNVF